MNLTDLNNEESLHYRLLEMLPLATLKKFARVDYLKDKTIKHMLEVYPISHITRFFIENMDRCRQHVHLFIPRSDMNVNKFDMSILFNDDKSLIHHFSEDGKKIYYYFIKTNQVFISYEKREFLDIFFYWPVKIIVARELIIFYLVILERSSEILSHLELEQRHKTLSESELVQEIKRVIKKGNNIKIKELDMNKVYSDGIHLTVASNEVV